MYDNKVRLRDGRDLGYALYGSTGGIPVFYFHGTPSSRLEPMFLSAYNKDIENLLRERNILLIAVDRPGMGLSTFNSHGSFDSFADDVVELARHLNISAFRILCWSGGGPYALAAANRYPSQVAAVYIITGFTCSFSEPGVFKNMAGNRYFFSAARYAPWLMRLIMNKAGKQQAEKPLPQWLSQLEDADQQMLEIPGASKHFTKVTTNEACRFNSNGVVHEARLYYNIPRYKLTGITQPVHFWYSSEDKVVTKIHAESIERQVPNSVMHYKKGEGHISIYIHWVEEILDHVATK
jgi:pimeloyl-ACP methyl ester carboxylesterase